MPKRIFPFALLIAMLFLTLPVRAQQLLQYSPNVSGYQGCLVVEDMNSSLYLVLNSQYMTIYMPVGGAAMRFWINTESGPGILPVLIPGTIQPPDAFDPWSPPATINWIMPVIGETLLLNSQAVFRPDYVPDRISSTLSMCPQPVPAPRVVAPVVYPAQNILHCAVSRFALDEGYAEAVCDPDPSYSILSSALQVDGRIHPEVVMRTREISGSLCISWRYQAFHDSSMFLMIAASDGYTYPYPVEIVADLRVNNADTMLCRYSDDLSTLRPRSGDFLRGLIYGLGFNPTDELINDFLLLNGRDARFLNPYLSYEVPQSWLELYHSEGLGSD